MDYNTEGNLINIFVDSLVLGLPIIALIYARKISKIKKFNKIIDPIISSENLTYDGNLQKRDLNLFKMFKQIKKYNLNHFTIYGTYKDNEIRFFQMGNYNAKFSVAMITMDKYAPEFDHILILPKTVLTFGKGYNLEWVDFNKKYLSKLDNPKEALNVLSPTFMETLVDLKNKYGKIEIEYFEDKDYQSNSLIVVKEGHIFDVFKYREDRAPNDIKVLNDFLDDVVKLKSSI